MRNSYPVRHAALVAAFVSAMAVTSAGQAQTNSTGNLAGIAAVGDIVVVENPKTGFKRTVTVAKNGHYRVGALPIGSYVVSVRHADGTVYLRRPASVRIGLTTQIKTR